MDDLYPASGPQRYVRTVKTAPCGEIPLGEWKECQMTTLQNVSQTYRANIEAEKVRKKKKRVRWRSIDDA